MKVKMSICIFFALSFLCYTYEVNWSPLDISDDYTSIIYTDGEIYSWFYNSSPWISTFPSDKQIEDGFILVDAKIIPQTDRLYVLEGQNIIVFEQYFFPWNKSERRMSVESIYKDPLIFINSSIDEWKKIKFSESTSHITKEGWNKIILYKNGLKQIHSSSYLSEEGMDKKKTLYREENVMDKLFYITGDGTIDLYYDNLTPPWVEGVEGYGVGEYLDIEFKYAADEIQVLNGFVDFRRMHLYKDNSRVKRVRIESENPRFSGEYELEDVVRYNLIRLPMKTGKIRMTILDVYPGRKWKDTAISSILVTDPNQVPYEEQKEKLIALMKANGVWEKIEEYKRGIPDQ